MKNFLMRLLVELNENINIPIILEYDIYKMDMSICKKIKYDYFNEVNVYNNYYEDNINHLFYKTIISDYSSKKYIVKEKINELYIVLINTDSIN